MQLPGKRRERETKEEVFVCGEGGKSEGRRIFWQKFMEKSAVVTSDGKSENEGCFRMCARCKLTHLTC